MSKEISFFSHYGPGGKNCPCCGPDRTHRKQFFRTVKRRMKQETQKTILKELGERQEG